MDTMDRASSVALSATLAPLGEPQSAMQWLARRGFAGVQLSASQSGLRPRELDAGARRGLREDLRRNGLQLSGIDLWIPVEHFSDPAACTRALDAFMETLRLAEYLGRCPVSCMLPSEAGATDVLAGVIAESERRGVRIADFARTGEERDHSVGLGIDVAMLRARAEAPALAIARAGSTLAALRLSDVTPAGLRTPFVVGDRSTADLLEIRAALDVCGIALMPVVDARQWPDPQSGLDSTLAAWLSAGKASHEPPRRREALG